MVERQVRIWLRSNGPSIILAESHLSFRREEDVGKNKRMTSVLALMRKYAMDKLDASGK